MGDCRAQQPSGYISSYSGRGLPGLSGGRRHRRNIHSGGGNNNDFEQVNGTGALATNNTLIDEELVANQSGGRYSFDLAEPLPGSAAPWAGGIPTVQRIPCEATVHNSLNKQAGGFSLRNVYGMKKRLSKRFSRNLKGLKKFTPSLATLKKLTKGLKKRFTGRGGKFSMKNVYKLRNSVTKRVRKSYRSLKKRFTGRGGGLGTDSAAYYAPTAGFDNKPSSWLNSVGAPVQLQIPYDAKAWNPACLKTN
jgi:hypothetical protein